MRGGEVLCQVVFGAVCRDPASFPREGEGQYHQIARFLRPLPSPSGSGALLLDRLMGFDLGWPVLCPLLRVAVDLPVALGRSAPCWDLSEGLLHHCCCCVLPSFATFIVIALSLFICFPLSFMFCALSLVYTYFLMRQRKSGRAARRQRHDASTAGQPDSAETYLSARNINLC